jgi:hypothetical protein
MIVRLDGSGKLVNAAARRRAFIGNDGAARKKMGDHLPGRERIERAARNIGLSGYAEMQRLFGRLHGVGESFSSSLSDITFGPLISLAFQILEKHNTK